MDERPDPDVLLAAVTRAEARTDRSELKLVFGLAAGVGKMDALQQVARARRARGIDVVGASVDRMVRLPGAPRRTQAPGPLTTPATDCGGH